MPPVFSQQRRLIAATIRFFDLFSGIGGFREGLRRVGGFAVIVGGIQLGKVFDIEMTAALQRVEKMGAGTVSVIGCIVSVILIVISYKISVRIMEKKEF